MAFLLAACDRAPDDPIVVLTGWGTPQGFDETYDAYIYWRTSGGERVTSPDQPCTQWHTGTFPYQVEILRTPYAVAQKVEGLERLWDSLGMYRLSGDGQSYLPVGSDAGVLSLEEAQGLEITPFREHRGRGRTRLYGPDPRDGTDHLAGTYIIRQPNGVHDFWEMDRAYRPRIVAMMGWDPDAPASLSEADIREKEILTSYIEEYFDGRIEWAEGYYANAPGLNEHLKDTAPEVAGRGYRNIVLAKPITDHNIYANVFWDLNLSLQSLCRAGYDTDEFDIQQVRAYGRTPEYNRMLLDNLNRHLRLIKPGEEVAVIYTTFGLPWPGSNPVGPMSNAMPWINEVFHENAYLNLLSFKRYVETFEQDYRISFARTGGQGGSDARSRNLFAYAMFDADTIGYADDPLRYMTLRDSIEDAILEQGKEEVVILLSHWGGTFWVLLINMRETWDIPLNSIAEIQAGEFRKVWCERYSGPGQYEQLEAIDDRCPDGYARIQISEAFEDFVDDASLNYAARIRGGIERFGILPNLGIDIVARGEVSRTAGGRAAVEAGPLAGVEVVVPADPQPGLPEGYRWEDRYRPSSATDPKPGPNAVRAINEYTGMDDYLDGAKDDFILMIGTQGKRSPDQPMPVHPRAVSPTVYIGPYRTLFNAPATVTLRYDSDRVTDVDKLRPYVYSETRQRFELSPPVLHGQGPWIDPDAETVSFQVQTLGLFALAEEQGGAVSAVQAGS